MFKVCKTHIEYDSGDWASDREVYTLKREGCAEDEYSHINKGKRTSSKLRQPVDCPVEKFVLYTAPGDSGTPGGMHDGDGTVMVALNETRTFEEIIQNPSDNG